MLPIQNNDGQNLEKVGKENHIMMLKCGQVSSKRKMFGSWKTYQAELCQRELRLWKGPQTKSLVSIPINKTTKVGLICHKDGPTLVVENEKKKIVIKSTSSPSEIFTWLLEIRSAAFFNMGISMQEFERLRILGRGFFGKAILASHRETGEWVVIKTVDKKTVIETRSIDTILTEFRVVESVKSPFIAEMKYAFQSSTKLYMGYEFLPGGNLLGLINSGSPISELDVRMYVAEIGLALHELHMNGIVYGNLKPENILIGGDGHLKLSDFRLCKGVSSAPPGYGLDLDFTAPEVLENKSYGYGVDWWALGILAWQMLYRSLPFQDENRVEVMEKILHEQPTFQCSTDPLLTDLIQRLLNKDPQKRADWDYFHRHPIWAKMPLHEVMQKKLRPAFIPDARTTECAMSCDSSFSYESALDSISSSSMEAVLFRGCHQLTG